MRLIRVNDLETLVGRMYEPSRLINGVELYKGNMSFLKLHVVANKVDI